MLLVALEIMNCFDLAIVIDGIHAIVSRVKTTSTDHFLILPYRAAI